MASRATITIYLPQKHRDADVLERLEQLAKDRDRSVNYLVSRALVEFVEREEQTDNPG